MLKIEKLSSNIFFFKNFFFNRNFVYRGKFYVSRVMQESLFYENISCISKNCDGGKVTYIIDL